MMSVVRACVPVFCPCVLFMLLRSCSFVVHSLFMLVCSCSMFMVFICTVGVFLFVGLSHAFALLSRCFVVSGYFSSLFWYACNLVSFSVGCCPL